jgi:predicted exporter
MLPLRGVTDAASLSNEIAGSKEDGVALLDLKEDFNRLYQSYREEALVLALLGALAIVVLLSVFLRSVRRVYLVLTPLIAAVTMTTAVLAASGQKLSIFHLTGLLLVVAVGSNYSLFFESQSRPGEHRERTITSLALANLCTVIGFGILSFSRVPVLHGIGTTVAIGTVLSLIFSAVLIEHAAPESELRPVV